MRRLVSDCPIVDEEAGSWALRRCGGDVRPVLVSNYCTSGGHRGHLGPCCRGNAAMEFFLDRLNTRFAKVKFWFYLDDDVYVRSIALLHELARYDQNHPYNFAASASFVGYPRCDGPIASYVRGLPWQVVSRAVAKLHGALYLRPSGRLPHRSSRG